MPRQRSSDLFPTDQPIPASQMIGRETHCDACFTGDYPLEHTESANGKFALEDSAVELPVLPRA